MPGMRRGNRSSCAEGGAGGGALKSGGALGAAVRRCGAHRAVFVPGRQPAFVAVGGGAVQHVGEAPHLQALPGVLVVAQVLPVAGGRVVLQHQLRQPVHAPDLDLGHVGAQPALQRNDRQPREADEQHDQQGGQRQEDLAGKGQLRHGRGAGMAAFCDMHAGRAGGCERCCTGFVGGRKPMMSAECGGNWEKRAAPFLHDFSWMRRQHEAMNPELSLALLGAITVFFWLVAQAWTLLVMWAEGCATRPAPPARTSDENQP
jgi:hypothetical protein